MIRSFGYVSTKMVDLFITYAVVIVFLSWNGFSPYYDSIIVTTLSPTTTSSSKGFCQAFVPHHYGVRQLRKPKQIPNKCIITTTPTTTLSCHDDFCGVDDDDDCEHCEGKSTPRRSTNNRLTNEKQRQNHNPSRRDFFAWNTVLAGIASGTLLSIRGTNAEEIANVITTTTPTTDLGSQVNNNNNNYFMTNNDQYVPYSSVRRYKTVELSNGMTALLVSDKTARQSSAALTINGAGQFAEPSYLNGLAHLMEHIALSSQAGRSNQGDFQEWLDGDYAEGFSNGFTAYEKVCFHFQCETSVFPEALDRFSNLFSDKAIQENCRNKEAVKREIRRVNSELDKNDLFTRELYLTKSLINPDHPYAKMTLGSTETLERIPAEADINVSKELYDFFTSKYQPDQTILVVVSSSSLSSLENMIQPFASTLSRQKKEVVGEQQRRNQRIFPNFLLPSKPINPICLFREKATNEILADNLEKISFQWALDQDYKDLRSNESFGTGITTTKSSYGYSVVTATEIGFVMAEILGRRGPGSLFQLLQKSRWIPEGNRGVPKISFPVDVSGFQIMRLEIVLTLLGFAKRSSVIAAVYECLGNLRSNPPSREMISQYCTVAQLYGHVLAPRPPDAIELAFDGQIYGVDGPFGVGTPGWRLMPPPEDIVGVRNIQITMQAVLSRISDPSNAITIVTASQRAIQSSPGNGLDEPFPFFSPASWDISPITQARYLPQNNILAGKINEWLVARQMEEKLQPPVLNPLIPPTLRPPRIPLHNSVNTLISSNNEGQDDNLQVFSTAVSSSSADAYAAYTAYEDSYDPTKSSLVRDYWALLKVYSHNDNIPTGGLSLPRMPPEKSSRSVFVLQLMSSRPPRASAEMAAHAEVWRISLEYALSDLAELGAPAGLAYEISYNKFGMRVAILGLSQNIASYSRRLCRRIVDHTNQLLEGPDQIPDLIIDTSIRNINRFRMSSKRKRVVLNTLQQTTASDAALEGASFFNSCSGGVCVAQGDMLPSEALALLADLKKIFRQTTGVNVVPFPAVPDVDDLLYRVNWIPRAASVCTISGATLISNPCGRVPR
jgi:insulysin